MKEAAVVSPRIVALVSIALGTSVSAALLWLIYVRAPAAPESEQLAWLPGFNASCNALSAILLVLGYAAIRNRRITLHMRLMLAALCSSALFLAGYVTHHSLHGDTVFRGAGAVRPLYFAILISHIVLSVVVLPLILSTLYFALGARFPTHKRIARITFPLWLYVSISGVLVYVFLRACG